MSEVQKKETKQMNPKKALCSMLLCFIILCMIAGVGTIVKFGDRIQTIQQQVEQMHRTEGEDNRKEGREENRDRKEIQQGNNDQQETCEAGNTGSTDRTGGDTDTTGEKDRETDWKNLLQLTGSDYIYLVCIVLAFWVLLCIYWLYVTVYVAAKAGEVGANVWLFGALTLVTNLFGAVCLWAYIRLYRICPGCGKLQSRKANYCAFCGTAMYQKCPDCGARVSVKDQYCTGCGRKMHEEK